MKALDKQTHTYVGAQERLEQLVSWWSITEEKMPKPYDQSSDSGVRTDDILMYYEL